MEGSGLSPPIEPLSPALLGKRTGSLFENLPSTPLPQHALEIRVTELRAEIILTTALFKDEEAKHASIKADIMARLHDVICKVDPDRARRAVSELIDLDNELLLSYIADPYLIRTPILPVLNKIKQSENRAKLDSLKKTDPPPQDVSLDMGGRNNV